jgi:hypothetical protein
MIGAGDLPRGTVTFLFTDIESSTALWEQDAAAMRSAVGRLARLFGAAEKLRETVASWSRLSGRAGDQETREMAMRALGDEPFGAAWSAGRVLPWHPAINEEIALAQGFECEQSPQPPPGSPGR